MDANPVDTCHIAAPVAENLENVDSETETSICYALMNGKCLDMSCGFNIVAKVAEVNKRVVMGDRGQRRRGVIFAGDKNFVPLLVAASVDGAPNSDILRSLAGIGGDGCRKVVNGDV